MIPRGAHVIVRDMEGMQRAYHLNASCTSLKVGRYHAIPAELVLSVPFGSALRWAEGEGWTRHQRWTAEVACQSEDVGGDTATNQHFAQDNTAQSLRPGDVSNLKAQCSGEEVVAALASNSATFNQKTKFSQEKYLAKKGKKHIQQVILLPPTVMDLCETYLKASRQKACGLRFEQLSAILCQADVACGRRFFVLDCAQGLVVGAIAQRLGGLGRVYRAFRGGCSDKGVLELDLSEAAASTVRPVPLEVLACAEPLGHDFCRAPDPPRPEATAEELARHGARTRRAAQKREDLLDLSRVDAAGHGSVDAVVIVGGDETELAAEALARGIELLGPGGRLVVFGPALQPLAERQGVMRRDDGWADVRLTQFITREYQVLPQRTHPHMQDGMHLCDGFLLTATRVVGGLLAAEEPDAKRSRTE